MSIPTTPQAAAEPEPVRPPFWERFSGDRRPEGQDLAALRRGIDREPGAVPTMWRYYTALTREGHRTAALVAEHHALTLFALHQQSRPQLMHRAGVGLGTAVRTLKHSGAFSAEAVDRRFAAAATATSVGELAHHLRGLITQLRGIGQPLDYSRLTRDLRDWPMPERAGAVRRRWGSQFFAEPGGSDGKPDEPAATAET